MKKEDARPLTRNLAPFGVRMPPDLKERVERAAKANNRSMNAEIVATLEEKYPPPSLDLNLIAGFLDSLHRGPTDSEGFEDRDAYIDAINLLMRGLPNPYRIVEEMGAVTFYPYGIDPSEISDMDRAIKALNEAILPGLTRNWSKEDLEAVKLAIDGKTADDDHDS